MDDGAFKICPFCKERIRQSAIKCRYCGEWLEAPPEAIIEDQPDAHAETGAISNSPTESAPHLASPSVETSQPIRPPLSVTQTETETRANADTPSPSPSFPTGDDKYMPPEMRRTPPIEANSLVSSHSFPDDVMPHKAADTLASSSCTRGPELSAPVGVVPNALLEPNVGEKRRGMAYIYIAWFLLALHVLSLMGMLLQAREHHGFEGMLSNIPSRHLSATIIGLMIGSNFLTIPALLLGLVAWAFRRNRAAKPVVAVALILIVITTVVAFLLDTAAPR